MKSLTSNYVRNYSSQNCLSQSRCPECKGTRIIIDFQRGERICSQCGFILESAIIDLHAEWRDFTLHPSLSKSRAGLPPSLLFHDKGLFTTIDSHDYDGKGQKLSPNNKFHAYRLRKWQARLSIQTPKERNLAIAMAELTRMGSQIHLTKFVEESAAILYRRALEKNLIKGRTIESMVAAALYASCRILNIPKTLSEFKMVSGINPRELSKSYRILVKHLNLKIPTVIPARFVSKFAHDLQISAETQYQAAKILHHAHKRGITSGKDPSSLAAASIYLATIILGENKTQKEIAKVAHITEVTVRNRFKELAHSLNFDKRQKIDRPKLL